MCFVCSNDSNLVSAHHLSQQMSRSSSLPFCPRRLSPQPDPEAFKRLYRTQILGFPGPVDRWLSTNSRTGGSLNFLKNYMYLVDLDCEHNVRCLVQRRNRDVSSTFSLHLMALMSDHIHISRSRMTRASLTLQDTHSISCAGSHRHLESP